MTTTDKQLSELLGPDVIRFHQLLEIEAHAQHLSDCVIAYGRTLMDDAAESEWDAVLRADKELRNVLR